MIGNGGKKKQQVHVQATRLALRLLYGENHNCSRKWRRVSTEAPVSTRRCGIHILGGDFSTYQSPEKQPARQIRNRCAACGCEGGKDGRSTVCSNEVLIYIEIVGEGGTP